MAHEDIVPALDAQLDIDLAFTTPSTSISAVAAAQPYPCTCVLPTHAVPLRNLLMSDEPRHVLDSYAGLTKTKGVFWTEGIVRAVARAFQPAGVVGYAVRCVIARWRRYRKVYVVERRCTPSSMGFVVRRELLRISWVRCSGGAGNGLC